MRHRAERAHAAVALVRAPLVEEHLARALVGAGEQRADHHAVRAAGDRLGEVARIFDAPVADHRHAGRARGLGRLEDRGQLRHADAGDDAGGADRARTDADLDRVRAGVDQRLRALARRHVAGDDRDLVGRALDAPDLLKTSSEWPCAVSTTRQSTPAAISISARSNPLSPTVVAAATRRRPSTSLAALGCVGRLLDVLDGDEADAALRLVDDHQLLDAVQMQEPARLSWLTPSPTVTTLRVMSPSPAGADRRRSARRDW